jgi:hypothetical protein
MGLNFQTVDEKVES